MAGDPAPLADIRSTPPQVVAVLGVGRSGTSAITRGLETLGIALGNQLRPGGGKNPTGFFEDQGLLSLNKRLRRALGLRADSVSLIEPDQWHAPHVEPLYTEAKAAVSARVARYGLWGFKYGRTLRLLPFWLEVFRGLDLRAGYVLAVRNPLSVARSRAKLEPRRGLQEQSDLEWLVNVVPYLSRLKESPLVAVDYDCLMSEPQAQLQRVVRALSLPGIEERAADIEAYAQEFLRPGLRHSHFTEEDLAQDPRVNPLTQKAYGWLRRLALDELSWNAEEFWETWISIEEAMAAMGPTLSHLDRVEAALRRAQRSPWGPLQAMPQFLRKLRGR